MNLDVIPDITMLGRDDPHRRVVSTRPPTVGRLAALVHDRTARPETWWHLVRFDPAAPARVPLDGADGAGLWLIAWPPGYGTEAHAHAHDCGQVAILIAGELTEVTLTPHGGTERRLTVGRVRVHGGGHLHRLANPGPAYAVTLHARPAT